MNWNLSQPYNPDHFIDRCYDILDRFEEFDEQDYISLWWLNLKHITSIKKLWESKSLEDLIVLEIEYNSDSDPRVWLTKEVQKVISKMAIEWYRRDHCLAIIKNPQQQTYRLSLISFSYNTEKKIVTSAKRFSFLLWPWEKIKTPTDYLIKNSTKITSIAGLTTRFDVEVVRKEFFNLYINLFLELYQEVKKYQYCFKSVNNGWLIDLVSFSKNLMGKMIFLYFIQKKGWLWLTADQNFKDHPGDPQFFKNNFDTRLARDENLFHWAVNFYNDFLEPLFYSGLNKKNPNDWHEKLQMKVPYLNGWLFEEEYKDRETTSLPLENNLFKAIVDAFDTYNFTIDENDPMDQEIAVDPEMLGKIFENMISINSKNIDEIVNLYLSKKNFKWYPSPDNLYKIEIEDEINKKLWAYYTPRDIVHYMTREALIYSMIEFLSKKLTDKSREELEVIVRELRECKDKHLTTKDEIEDREWQVATYQTLKSVAFDVKEYLLYDKNSEIKPLSILDPAVWSGAFPMGILQEMTGLVEYLIDTFGLEKKSRYEIKQSIIRDSIYGVDIDPGAVDIARLRFWLSLIVDAHEPIPLPNLEFKFVCANSIIPLESDTLFTNTDIIAKLRSIKQQYFQTSDYEKKQKLQADFGEAKLELLWYKDHKFRSDFVSLKQFNEYIAEFGKQASDAKNKQFNEREPFDASVSNKWFDSEMIFDTEKFDIVIGNPPYWSDIDQDVKKLEKLYPETTKAYKDIYKIFFDKWIKLLYNWWIITYITPNTFLLQPRYVDLRTYLLKYNIKQIINLWEEVFKNVVVSVAVIFTQKINEHWIIAFGDMTKNNKRVWDIKKDQFRWILQSLYYNNSSKLFVWLVREKLNNEKTLSEIIELKDWWFKYQRVNVWLANKWKNDLSERLFYEWERRNSNDIQILIWKDIDKNGYYVNKNVKRFLHWNYKDILRSNEKVYFNKDLIYSSQKLIWRQTSPYFVWTYLDDSIMFGNTIQWWTLLDQEFNLKYILWILNSTYLRKLYSDNVKEWWKVFPQVKLEKLRDLPIKIPNKWQDIVIISLVDEIISLKNTDKEADTSILERTIDILIYKLYELTLEDSQIIDPTLTQEEWDKVNFE